VRERNQQVYLKISSLLHFSFHTHYTGSLFFALQKKLHFSLVFLFYEYGFFLLLANWGNRSVNGNTPMILAIFIFFTTNLCVFAPKPVCLRGTIFPVSETKRVDSIFASFQSIDRATSASKSFPFLSTLRVFWLADGAADANEPSSSLGSYVWPG
jgi:hypothetical protein